MSFAVGRCKVISSERIFFVFLVGLIIKTWWLRDRVTATCSVGHEIDLGCGDNSRRSGCFLYNQLYIQDCLDVNAEHFSIMIIFFAADSSIAWLTLAVSYVNRYSKLVLTRSCIMCVCVYAYLPQLVYGSQK